MPGSQVISRGSTAMRRRSLSRPTSLALDHGVLRPELTLTDFGCGHGDDFRALREVGYDAVGWDPEHLPTGERRESDVCVLSYVLNVIEDTAEREQVLRQAFALARRTLVVAVRVDRSLKDAASFADGVLTRRGTFQRLYTQTEFREYVQRVLGVEPVIADLGIAYLFRNEEERARYLANTTFRRRLTFDVGIRERFAAHELAQQLVEVATKLGRLPSNDEFEGWSTLAVEFGGVARVGRLVLGSIDAEAFAGSLRERAEDILLYLAKLRFAGVHVPKLGALPSDLQRDVRVTWGSLKEAQDEALVLLFSLGREDEVRKAMRNSSVGKLVGDDFYVHVASLDLVPPVLRLAEFAARKLVGQVEADLVKISEFGRAVSFLRYPEFDTDPHPALRSSLRVYLPRAKYELREYGDANPFILHRKELFVASDYPGRERFELLSRAEEQAGLLGGHDIGTREGWQRRLETKGLQVVGHTLCHGMSTDVSMPIGSAPAPEYPRTTMVVSPKESKFENSPPLFGELGVHRSGGEASLKKPMLLVTVVAKLSRGQIQGDHITFETIEADFKRVLEAATGKPAGNLAEPFVRLQTSSFWRIRAPEGIEVGPAKRTLMRDDVWAELGADALQRLGSRDACEAALESLIARWVPEARQAAVRAELGPRA